MPDTGQGAEEAHDNTPEEPPHKKWKPKVNAFKEAGQEAFSKDAEVVRAA